MTKYLSQKELVKAIETNLSNLESGQLTPDEIEGHLDLVRELYERTLILRYKVFEQHTTIETTVPSAEEIAPVIEAQELHEEIVSAAGEVIAEEAPDGSGPFVEKEEETEAYTAIEFDFFSPGEEPTAEETIQPEPVFTPDPAVQGWQTEEKSAPEKEEETESFTPEETYDAPTETKGEGRYENRIAKIEQEIRNQIGFNSLPTLIGAFGLNERLLYINELFDGSSESFSDAIKYLDTRSNLSETTAFIEEIAEKFNWDIESETVEEFIQKLCRRYA